MYVENKIVLTYLVQLMAERDILEKLAFMGGACLRTHSKAGYTVPYSGRGQTEGLCDTDPPAKSIVAAVNVAKDRSLSPSTGLPAWVA